MSMPQEIVDKFQQYLDNLSGAIVDIVQHALPDLSPEEQQDAPIIQSESFFAHCMFRAISKNYLFNVSDNGLYYTVDIELKDNDILFGNQVYVGKDRNPWTDTAIEEMNTAVFANPPESFTTATGDIYAFIGGNCEFKLYAGGVYDYSKVRFKMGADGSGTGKKSSNYFMIYLNELTYTIDENNVVYPNKDYSSMNPWGSNGFLSIKNYPIIGNIKDLKTINNFITKMGATNNYTNTYTTPDNKTITVYYGDNYIITHVNNDEPVSYNDVKNALNIAVNKINDDNDIDLDVPDYPIPPPPTDDDYVDMGLGVETDGMAMYNMAVVTRDELLQLITDFEANADTGLSFIPHVLGLYKLGFESSQLLTTTSDKIRLHKEPSKTAFNSADNYNIVKNQEVLIDCGSITVDREELLTNTFLDFSPYTTYEMFIPGCGWITLPDTIVGRTISVAIVFDLTTCSCKGVVRSEGSLIGGSGTTLATVNGIIGSSVPLSINETGLQRAAIMNGSTQAVMALGTAFMGVGIGNPYMGASGVAMAASALASNHIAGNSTYTSTKGGATDYSVFGDGWKAVLKITRPKLEIPYNYGHSVGFVVNRYDTLSNFSGFTVCVNPHILISATSDEKEEIKRLLEEGVILPEGE